jgi:hypothetical protein
MAKKGNKLSLLYLIGMALVVVGFICPMFQISFFGLGSASSNGFDFINFDNFGFTTIGAILIFAGAVLGLVFCFVGGKNSGMLKLVGLIATIAGGVVLILGYSDNMFSKGIGKFFIDIATYGFYMIIVGWIVALVGWVTKK